MDTAAYIQLITPLKDRLYRIAFQIVANSEEARDVVQEVCIKLWERKDALHNVENLLGLGIAMTKNLAIDKTRSKHRRTVELHPQWDARLPESSALQKMEEQEAIQFAKSIILQLPAMQQNIWRLRDLEEKSYQEIASELQIDINLVKVYLFRARQFIKQALLKRETT